MRIITPGNFPGSRYFMILFFLFIGFSLQAQLVVSDSSTLTIKEGTTLVVQNSSESQAKKSTAQKVKLTLSQGATLLTSEKLHNVEIVKVEKKSAPIEVLVKSPSPKNSFQTQIEEKVKETVVEKPKPQFHFHTLPASQSLAAGNFKESKSIPTTNPYSAVENSYTKANTIFVWAENTVSTFTGDIKSSLSLQSLWARPPPTVRQIV